MKGLAIDRVPTGAITYVFRCTENGRTRHRNRKRLKMSLRRRNESFLKGLAEVMPSGAARRACETTASVCLLIQTAPRQLGVRRGVLEGSGPTGQTP